MSIYIAGSLAQDRIMTFPGHFNEHILPDKLHIFNVSFLIDNLEEKRGGTAGNIAYNLLLLQEKSLILATIGKDGVAYLDYLKELGLDTSGIRLIPTEFTACCTIITDKNNNQINTFHPAAMKFPISYELNEANQADWGIVSPGNVDDMQAMPRVFKGKGVPYIYDPGQQIPALSGDALLQAITGSDILVTNDYELEMICKRTERTPAEINALTKNMITTLGEQGANISGQAGQISVGIAKPKLILDPTGAGDAYRSGLLKGLKHQLPLLKCAQLGAVVASFCIEEHGTQEHSFTLPEFLERHQQAFGPAPAIF